jgi:GTP cyclohydrolase I
MKTSDKIKQRIAEYNITSTYTKRWHSNDNISDFMEEGDIDGLQAEVEIAMQRVLEALVIDTENDHNTHETAKRVAKMFIKEIFNGRYQPAPLITVFPNTGYDQVYLAGPITIRSTCAHHFAAITGQCWVGIFPGKDVIGLSKFNRIIDWIASRPQIQEEMTSEIADAIQKAAKADGVAIVIKAHHHCLTHRGVREHNSDMTTSIMRGKFRTDPNLKSEFLNLLAGMKGFNSNG